MLIERRKRIRSTAGMRPKKFVPSDEATPVERNNRCSEPVGTSRETVGRTKPRLKKCSGRTIVLKSEMDFFDLAQVKATLVHRAE